MASTAPPVATTVPSRFTKRPKFRWPNLSVTGVWTSLPLLTLTAMGLAWFAASQSDILFRSLLLGFGFGLVIAVLLIGVISVHSNANAIAPLFMVRYGIKERARAHQLVMDMIMGPEPVSLQVVAGTLGIISTEDNKSKKDASSPVDAKTELFKVTGLGRATILIDLESAILVERGGKYEVFHSPKCELTKDDRYINSVQLRAQRELFEVRGVLTRDTVALDIKGALIFQIQQNKQHLEQTQNHRGDLKAIQRALLPRDEWVQRTKALVASAVHSVIRDCELWQIYAAPPKPPTPAEMATIYTLGKAILPHLTRVELGDRIRAKLNEVCWRWGVEVTRFMIEEINPPREICDSAYRAYLSWNKMSETIMEAEQIAQSNLRTAQIEYEELELKRKGLLLDANTQKQKTIVEAEADAEAYTTKMRARAEGALEFARRMEIIEQGLGNRLDEGAMRELLRALGFKIQEKTDEDPKWLMDLMARRGYTVREE